MDACYVWKWKIGEIVQGSDTLKYLILCRKGFEGQNDIMSSQRESCNCNLITTCCMTVVSSVHWSLMPVSHCANERLYDRLNLVGLGIMRGQVIIGLIQTLN